MYKKMLFTLKEIKRNKNFKVKYFINFYLFAFKIFIAIFLISISNPIIVQDFI